MADDIAAILDSAMVAHVGTVRDGRPVVIPMFYARVGDRLLLHGAPATGSVRRGRSMPVCATVTLLDGLVLARSAFHHSMNYRSVVVVGEAVDLVEPEEKRAALGHFVDALMPGRNAELRAMTDSEVRGTSVLELSLATASAKVRTGPPVDDEEDYAGPTWAGVVPIHRVFGDPIDDPRLAPGIVVPGRVGEMVDSSELSRHEW